MSLWTYLLNVTVFKCCPLPPFPPTLKKKAMQPNNDLKFWITVKGWPSPLTTLALVDWQWGSTFLLFVSFLKMSQFIAEFFFSFFSIQKTQILNPSWGVDPKTFLQKICWLASDFGIKKFDQKKKVFKSVSNFFISCRGKENPCYDVALVLNARPSLNGW